MAVLWSRGPEPSLSLLPFFLLLLPQAAAAMDGRGRRWRRRRGAPRRCTRAAGAARGAVERHLWGAVRARSEAAARLRWCAGDPAPLFFPSRRRATTVGGDQHGRRPAVVAQ